MQKVSLKIPLLNYNFFTFGCSFQGCKVSPKYRTTPCEDVFHTKERCSSVNRPWNVPWEPRTRLRGSQRSYDATRATLIQWSATTTKPKLQSSVAHHSWINWSCPRTTGHSREERGQETIGVQSSSCSPDKETIWCHRTSGIVSAWCSTGKEHEKKVFSWQFWSSDV